jgi:hypothetical protein
MAEKIFEVDTSIRDYLNNNKFLTDSNWSRVAITQLFRVDMVNKDDVDGFIAFNKATNFIELSSVTAVQDVVGFSLPADRFEQVSQNIQNQVRNVFVGVTRDQFRLRLIDNSNHDYRRGFSTMYGTVGVGFTSYGKLITRFPNDYYYNFIVRQIRKNSDNGLYEYGATYILRDCVTENVSDIDFTVEKMDTVKTEITGKFKNLIYM